MPGAGRPEWRFKPNAVTLLLWVFSALALVLNVIAMVAGRVVTLALAGVASGLAGVRAVTLDPLDALRWR